jgi:hypothetical protein
LQLPMLKWWQGVWGCPWEPIAGPKRVGKQREVQGLTQEWWGTRVARVLPVSRASGVSYDVAEELSDLCNALPNDLVYPRLCRPQAKTSMLAIEMQSKRGGRPPLPEDFVLA